MYRGFYRFQPSGLWYPKEAAHAASRVGSSLGSAGTQNGWNTEAEGVKWRQTECVTVPRNDSTVLRDVWWLGEAADRLGLTGSLKGAWMSRARAKPEFRMGRNRQYRTDGSGSWYLYLHFPKRACASVCCLSIWNQKIKFLLSSQILWPSSQCLASHLRDVSLPQLSDTIMFKGITKGTSAVALSGETVLYIQKSNTLLPTMWCAS